MMMVMIVITACFMKCFTYLNSFNLPYDLGINIKPIFTDEETK